MDCQEMELAIGYASLNVPATNNYGAFRLRCTH